MALLMPQICCNIFNMQGEPKTGPLRLSAHIFNTGTPELICVIFGKLERIYQLYFNHIYKVAPHDESQQCGFRFGRTGLRKFLRKN